MRVTVAIGVLLSILLACAGAKRSGDGEKLYFAVEVFRDGRVIAKPKLVGEEGKIVRVERRQPGATSPDYQLALLPSAKGGGYSIQLDVLVPEAKGHSELALLHGQERKIAVGELEVSLMVLRVDSPEFRALMDLAARTPKSPGSI